MGTTTSQLEILVGVADIAQLVGGTGSATVTNWRSRFPTFPEPRVPGSQPRFELDEVLDWLRTDGPRGRSVPEPSPKWRWERLVAAFATSPTADDARTQVTALVAVCHLLDAGGAWLDVITTDTPAAAFRRAVALAQKAAARSWPVASAQLAERLAATTDVAPQLQQLAEALHAALAVPGVALGDLLETALEHEPNERRKSPKRTRSAVARLMVSLAGADAADTVFDPAAGEGDVLDVYSRRTDGRALVFGQEYDAAATFVASVRLMVRGVTAELAAPGHDSIRDDQFADRRFSVVVLDPPIGGEYPLLRWVGHAVDHLRPDGRMVVALPLAELVAVAAARRKPDEKLRDNLAMWFAGRGDRAVHLDAVVVAPRGSRTDFVGPVALLAVSGVERHDRRDAVPVVWLPDGASDRREARLASVEDAVAGGGVSGLVDLRVDGIDVSITSADRLFDTLERLVEQIDRSSSSGRRSSDPSTSRRASPATSPTIEPDRSIADVPLAARAMSDNARRATMADSLMAMSPARRAAVASRPAPAPDVDRVEAVFATSADRSTGVDLRPLVDAAGELRLLIDDARRRLVRLDADVVRRLEVIADDLRRAIDSLDRS